MISHSEEVENMKIQKRKPHEKTTVKMYGKHHGRALNFTAAVREAFAPYTHVRVEFDKNGVVLTPTYNEDDYKLTIINGQMRMAWSYAEKLLSLPVGVELPVTRMENGLQFLMRIPDDDADV